MTSWANFGTSGSMLDMAPQSDNSAPHIAYAANGIGGQPSVSFDGEAYLQTAGSTAMSITANGGACFIVFKTDMDDTERGNRAIFGGEGSNRRLGLHFIAGSRNVRGFFFNDTASGDMAVEAGKTQGFSLMQWTTNNASTRYMMRDSATGASVATASTPTALNIRIGGNMLSWTPNFVGDIAEIRVYNRPLTGRERSEIQFELCSRYGVNWTGHGGIDDTALAWCANGTQFGYWEGDGLPEAVVTTATAGGATLTLDQAPAASAYTRGYLAHDGGDGTDRIWYVSAASAARDLPMTFSIDANAVTGSGALLLRYSESYDGPWSRVGMCDKAVSGEYRFAFPVNGRKSGFYRVKKSQPFTIVVK
ncbi:MAG: hypothetical protein IKH04_00770 [Kiritimatiellae bacterium]|nr:hypothetical protein [Kiritimatiellia bacterium]